jgi:type VI secretion system protein VasJ
MTYVLGPDFEKCLNRFSGEAPFGEDARYDSTFMDLKAEILKLTAMSSKEGKTDWKAIKAWSIAILSSKSKDMTVAGYLALALLIVDGYAGLVDGLEIFHKYVKDDWDGIFPPAARLKGRILGLEWLVTRLSPLVEARPATAEEASLLPRLRELAQSIGDVARDRCQADAPSFSELIGAITTRMSDAASAGEPAAVESQAAESAAPEPVAVLTTEIPAPLLTPAPAAEPAPRTVAPASAGRAVEAAAVASAADLKEQVRLAAAALRAVEPTSPIPFRLLRSLKWDGLTGPPPADPATGRTRVPPPRPQQRTALEGLYQAGQWSDLVNLGEGSFGEPTGTFWLDLQRYVVAALDGLGSAGPGRAAAVVRTEAAALLERFPGIAGLQFSDGSPFASEATRQWLEQLSQRADSMPALPPASPGGGGEAAVLSEAEISQARELFDKKKPAFALDILQRGIERAGTARSRFRARLAAARVCLQAEQTPWAKTLLEELVRDMEGFSFDRWEPETAVEVLQLLAVGYARLLKDRKTENRDGLREEIEAIKSKLFRLDMRAAAAVDELLRR